MRTDVVLVHDDPDNISQRTILGEDEWASVNAGSSRTCSVSLTSVSHRTVTAAGTDQSQTRHLTTFASPKKDQWGVDDKGDPARRDRRPAQVFARRSPTPAGTAAPLAYVIHIHGVLHIDELHPNESLLNRALTKRRGCADNNSPVVGVDADQPEWAYPPSFQALRAR